jgi:hypothetical protein
VTVSIATPAGIQSRDVALTYTLAGDIPATDITVRYSTDGEQFLPATEADAEESEGSRDLTVNPAGSEHVFVWDSGKDLAGKRESAVVVAVEPADGLPASTSSMRVHNLVFVAGVDATAAGSIRLYSHDPARQQISPAGVFLTGGTLPHDVLFHDGHFLVANQGSNNIAVLALDDDPARLTAVQGSPFSAAGAGARYLATDGEHVFVSNVTTGTVSVLAIDSGTFALEPHSSVPAPGCRSLVVRSGRLYVASETRREIAIFDVGADGTLAAIPSSPVQDPGLRSPLALAASPDHLHAANTSSQLLCVFTFADDEGLKSVAASPFKLSQTPLQQLLIGGGWVYAVPRGESTLLAFEDSAELDEDAVSTTALEGPGTAIARARDALIVAAAGGTILKFWDLAQSRDPAKTPARSVGAGTILVRLAASD